MGWIARVWGGQRQCGVDSVSVAWIASPRGEWRKYGVDSVSVGWILDSANVG